MKKFFVLLAAVFVFDAANAATVFPIATNPAVVNFGGGVGFDGANYIVGFIAGTNVVNQRVSGTNGSLLGSQIVVGSNPGFPPAIAGAFGKTNYLMTWSDNSVSSGVDMFGQFVSKSGTTNGLPRFPLLSTSDYNSQGYAFQTVEALASDGTNFLVVWQDQNTANFYGQLVTPSGSLSGSEFLISSQSGNGNSAAVYFGKTNYLVVWQSNNGGNNADQTYGEFVSRSGVPGGSFQIGQTASNDQNPLAIGFDGTNYMVAWNWDNSSGNWDIYGRLVSQTGAFPGGELQLVTDPGSQVLPALAFDGANYLMAWGDGSFNVSNPTVRFQFFNRSGSPANSEFTVFTAQGTNNPLFTFNGLIFDGTRFVVAATLGTVSTIGSGDVTGFPSGEVFGAFIPSSTAVQVTTTSLPDGTTNVPYSQTLTASGGQTPYTWTIISNALPAGLSLSGGGVISGTPTAAVTTNFIVQVKDNTNSIATQALSLTIDALDTSVVFTATPVTVSNTYNGPITLTVTGLKTNETVTVQKFLDANTNGVIDAGDLLVQQFNLTDGTNFVIGGVTNINVPGDLNPTNGSITAALNFQADFVQTLVGKYLLRLTSPTSHFTPITNSFAVTNFPFGQKFTGTVLSNGVAVPNAGVLLFPAAADSNPVGGAVANNSGIYTIQMPAGTYSLVPFKSNFVANFSAAPTITLSNNATITTSLALIPATNSISGQVVDAGNTNSGLPGLLVPIQPKDRSLLGTCFTDNNGNFTAGVIANKWRVGGDSAGPAFLGYVVPQNKTAVDTTTGSVAGVSVTLTKATALFYGTVRDVFGNPLPGLVAIRADDNNNGLYEADGYTDTNGNYATAAIGGLGNNDPWQVQIDNSGNFTNYIFSQPAFEQNGGGTNINVGQAVLADFTAIIATNYISGNVKFNGTNIVGVGVYAYATIGNVDYNVNVDTDTNGNYSFNVANSSWNVGVNQQGGDDSLDNMLGSGSYQPPSEQSITISNDSGGANFTIQGYTTFLSGQVLDDSGSPVTSMNVFAQTNNGGFTFQATTDSGGNFRMGIVGGSYMLFLNNDPNTGYPSLNLVGPTVPLNVSDGVNINNFILIAKRVTGAIQAQVNNPSSAGVSGIGVFANLAAGTTNYSSEQIQTDGSGAASVPVCNGNWQVSLNGNDVQNAGYSTPASQNVTIANNNMPVTFTLGSVSPLQINTTYLPDGIVGGLYNQQLSASGGQPSYFWSLTPGSLALPPGFSLSTGGNISGTPTNAPFGGTNYSFSVRVTDNAANTLDQGLSITVYPTLTISTNTLPNGTNGVSYTAQILISGGNTAAGYTAILNGSLPPGLNFSYGTLTSSNEFFVISGTPTSGGTFSFSGGAADADSNQVQTNFSITILSSLQITTALLTNATVGVGYTNQLQGSGGTTPYTWTISNGSQPLPSALTLSTNGGISGVPAASGTNSFIVRLTDHNSLTVTRSFTLVVNPKPALGSQSWQTNRFQIRLTGAVNQNYTVQMSTNLSSTNWTSLFITNSATTNVFNLTDPNATNKQRFYRILIGP
jgi:hypothetical protein